MDDLATFCRAAADRDRRSAAMNRASAAYHAALAVADNASADAWEALAASDEAARVKAEERAEAARVQARAAWAEWERLRDGGPIALAAGSLEDLAATVGPEPTGALAGGWGMTARRLLTLHHLAASVEDAGVVVRAAAILPDGRLKVRVDRCPVVEAWLEGAAPLGWTATPYRSGAMLMRAA